MRSPSSGLRRTLSHTLGRTLLALALAPTAFASEFRGRVSFGGVPVPGATVTLTQGAKVVTAVTDTQGFYYFPHLPESAGSVWKLTVRLFGFVPLEESVTVPTAAPGNSELSMLPLDTMLAEAKTIQPSPSDSSHVRTPRTSPPRARPRIPLRSSPRTPNARPRTPTTAC